MSLGAWASLSPDDQTIFREAARRSTAFMRGLWGEWEERARQRAKAAGNVIVADFDRKPFEQAMSAVHEHLVTIRTCGNWSNEFVRFSELQFDRHRSAADSASGHPAAPQP